MNYPLRNLLKSTPTKNITSEASQVRTGKKIALQAMAISNLKNKSHALHSYDYKFRASQSDFLNFFIKIPDKIWIEMTLRTDDVLFGGRPLGSHIIVGSALNARHTSTVNSFDMFLFFAAVDGSIVNDNLVIDHLYSLSASPLQLKFLQTESSQLTLSGYRKIARIPTKALEEQLIERDIILHRAALNFACHDLK